MSNARVSSSRKVSCCVLSLAVMGVAVLNGCSSPLSNNDAGAMQAHYNDALLVKSLASGSFGNDLLQDVTVSQGVRELTMVDASGPATAAADNAVTPENASTPTTAPGATTDPTAAAPNPAIPAGEPLGTASSRANDTGIAGAALNQPEPIFNLSLQDAIARTCKNSLAIRVEAYNPGIKEAQIIQAEAAFDPVIFGYFNWTNTDEPTLTPGAAQNGQNLAHQIGVRQLLPTGATASVSAGQTYRYLNPNDPNNPIPPFSTPFRDSYVQNLNATITQPLLRGFGVAVNEANIYLAKADHQISQATFKRQVITSVGDVENAYHNLVLARTIVDIQERLLAATEITAERVEKRKGIDADKIAISQTVAAVEARRADLIRARANLRDQSDALKALINDPEINIRNNALINPTDRPTAEFVRTSTAEAIETALRQRTELEEARLQIEKANIVVKVAKNDLLPKVDLTAGVQTNGLDNSFDAAFGQTVSPQWIDFNAGIRIEIPLGNRDAESNLVRRRHEQSQALTQMALAAQKVLEDVKKQLRALIVSYTEIQWRERARVAAAEELQAITQKENIVNLTPEFLQLKLDSQNRLAIAEQNLIQALVNYNVAIMRFEQSKGTLLEFNHISLDRAPIHRNEDDIQKIRFMGETYILK